MPLGYHSPFRTNDNPPNKKDVQPGESGNRETEPVGHGARQMRSQAAALGVPLPKAKGKQ